MSKLLVLSRQTPKEVRIFGLRGEDIEDVWAPVEEEAPALPDDWAFTSTSEDGICKYCQLMLHPDAPKIIVHQPNLKALIDSECCICDWVEVSIARGAPNVVKGFQEGDPELCDENSTACAVTIALDRESKFTRAIPSVGDRSHFAEKGVPLNLTTPTRLGDLFSRIFWQPFETRDNRESPERLTIVKTWIAECQKNHKDCSSEAHERLLPTRVLDLTGSPDVPSTPENIKIKLRDTFDGETGQYIALSYCWGASPEYHFITTQQNLNEHKNGIEFSEIPLTQREAILSALFLGIRYLWIDSLCIIQDSPKDWEREAAKMSVVYSNTMLTLAATSSRSPADGLLNPFQSARCVNIHDDLAMVRMETHKTVDAPSEPLNVRAWALQEAVLSQRMVSFGGEQWLWKCASRFVTEDGLLDQPRHESYSLNHWPSIVKQCSKDDNHGYLKHWYRLLEDYSRRVLTFQDDKLKAIAGLVSIVANQTGHEYVAGLWAQDISTGLMWQATSRGVTRIDGTIPTWSWASVNGAIQTPKLSYSTTATISLVKVEQEWQDKPMTSPLELARLHVSGLKITLSLGQQSLTQNLRYRLIRHPTSEEIFGEGFMDNLDSIDEEVNIIHCLQVYTQRSSVGALEHFMLLLLPVKDNQHGAETESYRRIGIGIIWDKYKFADGREGGETLTGALNTNIWLI